MPENIDARFVPTGKLQNIGTFSTATSPPMTQLAFHGVTTYRWSLRQDVAAALALGLRRIALWRQKVDAFGEDRSIALIRESGLQVSSLSWIGGFTGSNELPFDDALDDALETIRLAAELGAESVTLVSGGRSGHTKHHARDLLLDALMTLTEYADHCNVDIALQPLHPRFSAQQSFLSSLDAACDIIENSGYSQVRLALDVYHMCEDAATLKLLPDLVPYLGSVQLTDGKYPLRSNYNHRQLADGDVPLAEIVQALTDAGYAGCYEVAIRSRPLWRTDYCKLLNECCRRFDYYCRR